MNAKSFKIRTLRGQSYRAQKGALTLELAISLPILLLIIFVYFDLARLVQKYGELNRVAYSLAIIISQRNDFYRDKMTNDLMPLSQYQVEQLKKIAKESLAVDVAVKVTEYAHLNNITRFNSGDCQTSSSVSLPYQVNDNEPTVYVVELCQTINDFSLAAKFLARDGAEGFYVRALTVGR